MAQKKEVEVEDKTPSKKAFDSGMEALALQTSCEAEVGLARTTVERALKFAEETAGKYKDAEGAGRLHDMLSGRIAFAKAWLACATATADNIEELKKAYEKEQDIGVMSSVC